MRNQKFLQAILKRFQVRFVLERKYMEDSFRIVCGEDYKINLIPEERIIYKEKGKYSTKALVKHRRRLKYDKELEISVPTIEEMMYFMIKGEKQC